MHTQRLKITHLNLQKNQVMSCVEDIDLVWSQPWYGYIFCIKAQTPSIVNFATGLRRRCMPLFCVLKNMQRYNDHKRVINWIPCYMICICHLWLYIELKYSKAWIWLELNFDYAVVNAFKESLLGIVKINESKQIHNH